MLTEIKTELTIMDVRCTHSNNQLYYKFLFFIFLNLKTIAEKNGENQTQSVQVTSVYDVGI